MKKTKLTKTSKRRLMRKFKNARIVAMFVTAGFAWLYAVGYLVQIDFDLKVIIAGAIAYVIMIWFVLANQY